jgi:hypothetical protein
VIIFTEGVEVRMQMIWVSSLKYVTFAQFGNFSCFLSISLFVKNRGLGPRGSNAYFNEISLLVMK